MRAKNLRVKKSLLFILLSIAVLFGSIAVAQNLDDANAAYERKDWTIAFAGYKRLAELGNAEAQYQLGTMHANGLTVPTNYQKAAYWYRKAAIQGHAAAQSILAQMYDQGQGVAQNYKLAIAWHRKAAEHGPLAQTNQLQLGWIYRDATGVVQDKIEAHKWFNIAAIKGNSNAIRERDLIQTRMTPAQISEAQRRANSWLEKHP